MPFLQSRAALYPGNWAVVRLCFFIHLFIPSCANVSPVPTAPMPTYWKISPSGNTTLLYPQDIVSREEEPALAMHLMRENPDVEQVGFVHFGNEESGALPSLRMMGGEFCVNATRAFAALLYTMDTLSVFDVTGAACGRILVSGADLPIDVEVMPTAEVHGLPNSASVYASARLAFSVEPTIQQVEDNIFFCQMPGISHVVFLSPKPQSPQHVLAKALSHKKLAQQEALGLLWLNAATMQLTPYVYVAKTQSFIAETACGSGTFAAALALRCASNTLFFQINQPSGHALSVYFAGTSPYDAVLSGPVFFLEQGECKK